jgi:hypothetical protein
MFAPDVSAADKQLNADDLNLTTEGRVTSVGTTNPVEDFNSLIRSGYQISAGWDPYKRLLLHKVKSCFLQWHPKSNV